MDSAMFLADIMNSQLRKTTGLSWRKVYTLRHLALRGTMTVGEIASLLKRAAPTMTSLLDGMYRQGLIDRRHDTHDRRVVLIEVTPAGRIRLASAEEFLQSLPLPPELDTALRTVAAKLTA